MRTSAGLLPGMRRAFHYLAVRRGRAYAGPAEGQRGPAAYLISRIICDLPFDAYGPTHHVKSRRRLWSLSCFSGASVSPSSAGSSSKSPSGCEGTRGDGRSSGGQVRKVGFWMTRTDADQCRATGIWPVRPMTPFEPLAPPPPLGYRVLAAPLR